VTSPKHPGNAFFVDVAERLGSVYLRYNFTMGTEQEVRFLIDHLGLRPGQRVLDVGCGPGRHAVALARAGLAVTGVDVSRKFLDIAADAARAAGVSAAFFEVDARTMPFDDEFDAVISLCQGGFGLMGDDDSLILKRMMEAARPGAPVVVSAFNAYFAAATLREGSTLDVDTGVHHEVATITTEAGADEPADLWTSVYTPRELRLLCLGVGLVPEAITSVEPGDYAVREPNMEMPELLLVARRPIGNKSGG
jgi:SAM-dependent methyltransferase